MPEFYKIAVIGGGLSGCAAAISLANAGHKIALIAPKPKHFDGRTTALMRHSIDFLEKVGVWSEIEPHCAPMKTMRLVDGTNRLFRAPVVNFHAHEIDQSEFGFNIPNAHMLKTFEKHLDNNENITRYEEFSSSVVAETDCVKITLESGIEIETELLAAADGRNSMARKAANIQTKNWQYPQVAIVFNFEHELDHHNISTEFHRETGPFAQVPFPGKNSSLVWVVKPEDKERILGLSKKDINHEVETIMSSMLGKINILDPVQAYPLSGMIANNFGKGRIALIGEASHVFPPLGAQGLNLSLRDAIDLIEVIENNSEKLEKVASKYDRRRKGDVRMRTATVDFLNRTLLTNNMFIQFARAAGLSILTNVSPIKNIAMREGMRPGGALRGIKNLIREKIRR